MSAWYKWGIFYHIYPLGMTGAPKHNNAAEITNRFKELCLWIPHIKKLGCNALYIGPLFESASHGYDTRDYKRADRRLGDNESLKGFVKECHKEDIKVVVDGVFNHTGREFFAFRDLQKKQWSSAYKDWYKGVSFDRQSPLGDPFGYDAWQGHYELPCLNLSNPEVKEYLFDVIRFWAEEFHIDGIRLDCANVLDFTFMKEMRQVTEGIKQDFWLMGEVIHGDYSRWVSREMLHSVINYELHKSLYSGFNDHNFFEIAHNVRRLETIHQKLYTFVDNHDEDRIASKLNNKEHLFPVYLCLFTLPGIPSLYYGGEWGIEGRRTRACDEALRPAISITDEPRLHCPLTDLIEKLVHIHAKYPAYQNGRYQELLLTNRQYAFARQGEGPLMITAVNNDDREAHLSIPVPVFGRQAVNLMAETEEASILPITDGKIHMKLKGNWGTILEIKEEN